VPILAVPVLAGVALAATAAGTAMTVIGQENTAKSTESAERYNAAVEANNAGAAAQQSKFNAQQIQDSTRRNVANQRAAMAASGFDPNTGSFSDVTNSTKQGGELNRLSSIYSGRLGTNQQSSAASLSAFSASSTSAAVPFAMGASLIGGLSQATSIATNPNFGINN